MYVAPDCKKLIYSGRIDDTQAQAPVLVYPCSYIKMRFTGNKLAVLLENHHVYWDNYMGYMIDGRQYAFRLDESGKRSYELNVPSEEGQPIHEIVLFKRMDACHYVTFYGFELENGSEVLELPKLPERKIEVYGDSVSAGEVSEAVAYIAKEDPQHNGEYSNSWYSYAWITARKLNAQIHDIAQGGIALMKHTGWFCEPNYVGMEQIYDKIEYQPDLGICREWDFSKYTPHVVIIAIGQNDSHPDDYMASSPDGEKARKWKQHYRQFVEKIREKYPRAVIILATTILQHDRHWDDAIEDICRSIGDPKIYHFLYRKNGCGTPGHIRIPEAEQMALELSEFIESLGDHIWDDGLEDRIDYESGISNIGNPYRMKKLFQRAEEGNKIKIAFIGGSVTQGSLASSKDTCYAARVFSWWKETFPKSEFTYINAGIGGTTSQFGCARVQQNVLAYDPDFVIVEFSVNDESTEMFLETYEGLVRQILQGKSKPAVMIVHNVRYDNGANAQVQHAKIARRYELPSVSMQSAIYPQVVNGNIANREITPDDLHPNDSGHRLVAGVITHYLQKLAEDVDVEEAVPDKLPKPLTANRYEAAVRYQNGTRPSAAEGFYADDMPQTDLTDVFKNGWTASEAGAYIVFEFEASEIAVQYRKSVQKPAPVAKAVIDGKESESVILDGNFTEDWGDCLHIDTLLYHGELKTHRLEITILPTGQELAVPFYLASVIASK